MSIYLDNAATTGVDPAILSTVLPLLREDFGNPSSVHELGASAARALEFARAHTASVFEVPPGNVTFTSGGTEANNLALKGRALANPRGRHLIVSAIEHESVLASAGYLRRFHGFTVDVVPVDGEGRIDLTELMRLIRPDTTLAALMYANNEVGTIQDMRAIAGLCAERGVPVHVDAVQAASSEPLGFEGLGLAAVPGVSMSVSGHKLGAPKGIGALVSYGPVTLEPLVHGGGQENGNRSGTENVAFAVALGLALASTRSERHRNAVRRVRQLGEHLIDTVLNGVDGVYLTGARGDGRLPGHASFCFPGIHGEVLLVELERRGVLASSGSACAAGRQEPSHVLLAIGVSEEHAHSALRVSLASSTSEQQVTLAARRIVETARLLAAGGS